MPGATHDHWHSLLEVTDLRVTLEPDAANLVVIDSVSFSLGRSDALGIVGESGSGKSMLCRALIGTLARYGGHATGSIRWRGSELIGARDSEWRRVRGRAIAYVPQSSLAGLNPVLTIGRQLEEAVRLSGPADKSYIRARSLELLDLVRIPRAERLLSERSESLSGGMRQRVIIAAALAPNPALLILDEPTTALDVTVQAQILKLINELRNDLGTSVILVSHDLGVIEEVAERVATMYAGAVVELAGLSAIRHNPRHPYTSALIGSRVSEVKDGGSLVSIPGEPPSVGEWPKGCRFWPRCPRAVDACKQGDQPPLRQTDGGSTACIMEWRQE